MTSGKVIYLKDRKAESRWKAQVSAAVISKRECNFIERVPGMQKHYRVTEQTRQDIF
jgi:hypothetical protein